MRRSGAGRRDGARDGRYRERRSVNQQFAGLFQNNGFDFRFDADRANTSGANLTSLTDYYDATHLATVSAGTVAAPAADAVYGGARCVALTGTQYLDSNRTAAQWARLVNNTGLTIVRVVCLTSLAAARIQDASGTGSLGAGHDCYVGAGGAVNYDMWSAAATVSFSAATAAGAVTANVGTYITTTLNASAATVRVKNGTAASAVPSSFGTAPSVPLRIGAYADGSFQGQQKIRAYYGFGRVLTAAEYAIVGAKIALDTAGVVTA